MERKRVVGYIRNSLKADVTQSMKEMKDCADKHPDWDLTAFYVDMGKRGVKNRGMRKMFKDAQKNAFDMIIVIGLDRLNRDINKMYDLVERFNLLGITVFTIKENAEYSANDIKLLLSPADSIMNQLQHR